MRESPSGRESMSDEKSEDSPRTRTGKRFTGGDTESFYLTYHKG